MEITITMKIDDDQLRELFGLQKAEGKDESVNGGPYAVWFDETSTAWSKELEHNKIFLLRQQDYLNEKLKAKGYLFLNEVYDAIGVARTKAGQRVGWICDPDRPDCENWIDLGLFKDSNREFINGQSNSILIDPNVYGDILDYL